MSPRTNTPTTPGHPPAADPKTNPGFVAEQAARPGVIEVLRAAGESPIRFADSAALRAAILAGEIRRTDSARRIALATANDQALPKCIPVDEFSREDAKLRALYRPVWASGLRYAGWGVLAGIALKALDTTVTLFQINPDAGSLWLATIASLFLARKWPWAPAVPLVIGLTAFPRVNFFIMALGAAAAGAFFGAPLGMIVGVLVARFRPASDPTAPDALPEGSRPLWLGVALPSAVLLAGGAFYGWLHLKVASGAIAF